MSVAISAAGPGVPGGSRPATPRGVVGWKSGTRPGRPGCRLRRSYRRCHESGLRSAGLTDWFPAVWTRRFGSMERRCRPADRRPDDRSPRHCRGWRSPRRAHGGHGAGSTTSRYESGMPIRRNLFHAGGRWRRTVHPVPRSARWRRCRVRWQRPRSDVGHRRGQPLRRPGTAARGGQCDGVSVRRVIASVPAAPTARSGSGRRALSPDGSPGLGTTRPAAHRRRGGPGGGVQRARGPAGRGDADGSVWVWDADTLELIRHWPNAHQGVVFTVVQSGRRPDRLRRRRRAAANLGRRRRSARPAAADRTARVITRRRVRLDGTLATAGTQAGADGKPVGVVRLWDVAGRRVLAEHTTHSGLLAAVAVSPDGRRLATGGSTGSSPCGVSHRAGRPSIRSAIRCPATTPGGQRRVQLRGDHLVSSSSDGTLRLWTVPAASDLSRLLCDKLTENMDPASGDAVSNSSTRAVLPGLPVAGG